MSKCPVCNGKGRIVTGRIAKDCDECDATGNDKFLLTAEEHRLIQRYREGNDRLLLTDEEEKVVQRKRKIAKHEEYQYLYLLKDIMNDGEIRGDRTGVGTCSIFGTQMKFDLANSIPVLTTKKVYWKGVVEELLWFIRGETDSNKLSDKGVNIWKGNTSREFLDNKGLNYPEGFIGPGYGWQWRNWNGSYSDIRSMMPNNFNHDAPPKLSVEVSNYKAFGHDDGIDQLEDVISTIKRNPHDRSMIVSAWNPSQLSKMALPPCHMFYQFHVQEGRLNCQMYQRSVDSFLGLPFNIASYSLLTMLIAKVVDLKPGVFTWVGGDTHIYNNHREQVELQRSREPYPFPTIDIPDVKSLEDIENLSLTDLPLNDYKCHAGIKAEMAV